MRHGYRVPVLTLERHEPSPGVDRFVATYWVATWDRHEAPPDARAVPPQPMVDLVIDAAGARAEGPRSRPRVRVLAGAGRLVGATFRPAGFRPLLGRALATIADHSVPFETDLPFEVEALDARLAELLPDESQASEATTAVVERMAADPALVRVADVAEAVGGSERTLQRRFADHVGLSPKSVLRRYRLYEAAARARTDEVDWSCLAAELGYSDQSHLTRDFTATLGVSPERWAATRRCRTCRG